MLRTRIPVLEIPSFLRKTLSLPQGTLYVSKKGFVTGISVDVCVGDIVSSTLKSKTRVLDFKTRREYIAGKKKFLRKQMYVINPPGTISLLVYNMLSKLDILFKDIVVDGEEDLVTLAVIENNRCNTIAYGQPGVGVVIIRKNKYSLFRSKEILKTFKPVMYAYTSRARTVEQYTRSGEHRV